MMIAVALLIAAVVAVSFLYPRFLGDIASFALMVPVLGFTAWYFIDWGGLSVGGIVRPLAIGLGLGVMLFAAGLTLSADRPRAFLTNSFRGLRLSTAKADHLSRLGFQAAIILYEELIWRVFLSNALSMVMAVWLVVALSALLFWFVAFEDNWPLVPHSLEFFLFALVLGALYLCSGSVLLVWTVHAPRNLLIISAEWQEQAGSDGSVASHRS
ncbi:MAG: CPBP family intramembrane glutamic endopeptidase [Pseudomonadota bacterium]